MAPRSIWNGTVAFGSVCISVKLFSAIEDHAVHFREVRLSDGCRIVHRRVGSESGHEVPAERIAKAYETSRGQRVVLEDEEIAAARGSRPKVIEIEHFIKAAQIDPVYYDRPYILGAQPGSERAYRVLLAALERSDEVGVGRFAMRTRERLVALGSRGNALELYTMRFADEVIDSTDIDAPALRRAPTKQEIEMAERLIDTLAEVWDPGEHQDRYRASVLELIKRKAAGKEIEPPPRESLKPPQDLLVALQRSIDDHPRKQSFKARRKRSSAHAQKTTGAKS
ncbi:MAG TPA: Ku protein [Solirubrobacteraceae bacterium]|nr:Ku protein [Solirubrobacteraceae bacterium]